MRRALRSLLVLQVLGLAACANVLGISDFENGEEADSGTTDGAVDTAVDTLTMDGLAVDAAVTDTALVDSDGIDTRDATTEDSSAVDTGAADSGPVDSSIADTAPDTLVSDSAASGDSGSPVDSGTPDACISIVCASPPPASCAGPTTTRTYVGTGTCSAGTCSYAPIETPCAAGKSCHAGTCKDGPPSCAAGGDGLTNCGASGKESCCTSPTVPGGTFSRSFDDATTGHTDPQYKATVSAFRLDKYQVTVGRFRKFVDAWVGGWRPAAGAGKHSHLNDGKGLSAAAGGYEVGWDTALDPLMPSTKAGWDAAPATCNATNWQWSSAPGSRERNAMNCISWPAAAAFCLWDGGFLPSEAERGFAASAGGEQRVYPWSSPPRSTTIDSSFAVYVATNAILPVGSLPKGVGRWGHLDLAGNVSDVAIDWYATPLPSSCRDCAQLTPATYHVGTGGSFIDQPNVLYSAARYAANAGLTFFGARCARPPMCAAGFDDCDGNPANGCETALDTTANCGGCGNTCGTGLVCSGGSCVAAPSASGTSCQGVTGTVPGVNNCGVSSAESCCTSLAVPGGHYSRGYDGVTVTDPKFHAKIDGFALDKYEVTVGRYRRFVNAVVTGWRPTAGSGKHVHLNAGAGLALPSGGYESGWDGAWTAGLPTTKSAWDSELTISLPTWTSAAGSNESRPINGVTWANAYAFCIWDGGFLPSESELGYAAQAGGEQRVFPWSVPASSQAVDATRASYGNGSSSDIPVATECYGDGISSCTIADLLTVGSRLAGVGRWGHLDLAGNVGEWALDLANTYVDRCDNCLNLTSSSGYRVFRGGTFRSVSGLLRGSSRGGYVPYSRNDYLGLRCARPVP